MKKPTTKISIPKREEIRFLGKVTLGKWKAGKDDGKRFDKVKRP